MHQSAVFQTLMWKAFSCLLEHLAFSWLHSLNVLIYKKWRSQRFHFHHRGQHSAMTKSEIHSKKERDINFPTKSSIHRLEQNTTTRLCFQCGSKLSENTILVTNASTHTYKTHLLMQQVHFLKVFSFIISLKIYS